MEYPLTYKEYLEGLELGEFRGLKCSCGAYVFPPKSVCDECGGTSLEKTLLKGKGVIKTFTVIRVAPLGFKPPYITAMVEMEQGPWVIGNLLDVDPEKAGMDLIGLPVELGSRAVSAETYAGGETRILTFTPVNG